MPRLLFDCRVVSERIDGLTRYTVGLVREIVRQAGELEVTLILPRSLSPAHPLRDLVSSAQVRHVSATDHAMRLRAQVTMLPTYRANPAEVYHYPHFNLPVTAPTPAVVTVHDLTPLVSADYFRSFRLAKRLYFRLASACAVRRAGAVIVPSRATEESLVRFFPAARDKARVIYEGVDPSFRRELTEADLAACRERYELARPFLFYVGVTRPHKNLARLLRGYARASDRVPHTLVLAGQVLGDGERLRALAAELGLRDRVRWLDYVPQEDLPCLYALADAYVLCSLWEGFGLGVIEAMASGTPVVVSDTGAAAEVAGDAAITVDPRSVDAIAAGLLEVCLDGRRRDELRSRGRERAASFTWERAARETIAVYERLMPSR